MKIVSILLISILGLSFFLGCGETDTHVVADSVDSEDVLPLLIPPPDIDITDYPDGWVHLTDSDVAELWALEIPHKWWEIENNELKEKYEHASMLKELGNTSHVRFYIEARRNSPEIPWNEEILIAFLKTSLFLYPSEHNKREIERVLGSLPKDEGIPKNPPPEPADFTIEDAEAEHAALLKKYGDVPQVQIIADFLMKHALRQHITIEELFAFRQAKFELDPNDQPNRAIYEAYLQARADGRPLQTVDERKIFEEWINDEKAD